MASRFASPGVLTMDAAAFLTLAAALSVPSGYSYGALLLLVLGLCAWPGVLAGRVRWTPPLALWGTAIAVMGLVWGMHMVDDSGRLVTHSLGLDRCIKYLLVLLCLPALLVRRPGVPALRWGCAIGAIGAGLTALWEVLAKGLARADGYTNSIQFGNLALLLGVWSGVWALHADTPRQRAAGWLGAALGLTASLASGSRGGWVTLPLLVLLGLWLSPPLTRGGAHASMQRRGVRALGLTAALCALLVMLPPVQQRAELAAHEYLQQEQSVGESSVGLRLAFWQLAWTQGLAHPWVGVGQGDYEKAQRSAVARQEMPRHAVLFNHAHNEWLDMFAKRGLLGVLALALFYAVPGGLFWRALRDTAGAATSATKARRAAALCGLIGVVGFLGFGMTQVMFAHNNGNLMYLLTTSLWLAVCWHSARHDDIA